MTFSSVTDSSATDPIGLIYISLTSFIDYATATDSQQRLTVVRRVKRQMEQGYSPAKDAYKVPRDLIQLAKGGRVDASALPPNATRGDAWQKVVRGYNKWIGNKSFTPRPVKRKEWIYGDLVVGVNPEIALERSGVTTFYKLYFKLEPLTKCAAHTIYQMMFEMLDLAADEDIAILDLRKSKTIAQPSTLPNMDIAATLRADATAFVTLWNHLP